MNLQIFALNLSQMKPFSHSIRLFLSHLQQKYINIDKIHVGLRIFKNYHAKFKTDDIAYFVVI